MAGTEIGSDLSVCKVEIKNECGDGALDHMTKLDSVGSGEIVTYDCAIEFFQKGGKIVECDGLGAGDAEVEGVTKEDKIIKVNIVDFLSKLQINGVSHKPPVNVHMEDGENAKLKEQVVKKDNSESLIENNNFVELDDNSEAQMSHEAVQQLQTEATDDSESLTEKSKSSESHENLQTVEEIVDDDTECQNLVMDDDVLITKDDEAESAREVEQQLETDDLIVEDVSESLIKDSESVDDLDAKNMNDNVEKIDDHKEESQTVVMDDVLDVSGPEDNDPKVEDDSESLIENNEFVELDEKLKDTVEITDDHKETQTVVMDHVQNPLSLEDDEVKSVSELEQKLETESNNDLLVNDDSDSQIVNSESVEFDSKLQTVKEIDDNEGSQDVVVENVENALSQEDHEAQSVNEAEYSSETGSTDDEVVNESAVSQVSEIIIDENQTEVQLNESVEIMEDCPATESVKSEHENEEVCLEEDQVSQVEEAQFEGKKSQDRPALIFPPSFVCPEIKVQFGSYVTPIRRDQPKVILPATFVIPEVYIEFGSFSSHKKAPNKLPDLSVTETETGPDCGSKNKNSEIVTNDLQEENAEMASCLEVDEMEPECGSENNNYEMVTNDLQEENVGMATCHEVDEMEPECGSENNSEIVANDLQEENAEMPTCHEVDEMGPERGSENNNSEIVTKDLQEENAEMPTCLEVDEMNDVQKAEEEVLEDSVSEAVDAQTVVDEIPLDNLSIEEHKSEEEKLIDNAQLQLDEKTRCIDAISNEIQMKKESMRAQNEACNAANLEVKAAKGLVKSKGQEIDYFQRLIKKTNPVEDIDSMICKLVHMIKHETLCSKDESQTICEIKQLKSIRNQLALDVGFHDETQQALYQKDQIQEHVKRLKKELKSLKDGVLKAEVAAKSVRKKYEVELEEERGLRTQLKVANESRQEAYQHLNKLKNYPDEDKPSDDESKEKVAGNNEQIMKNEEHAEPTEMLDNKEEEKTNVLRIGEIELKRQHQLEENKNANEARTQAELQAQKEAEKKEKARLKRLRQKERKRAGGDVAESKETQNTEEKTQQLPQQHVLLKQLKRSIIPTHPAVAFANRSRKGLWKHSGKMVTTAVIVLSVISLGYTDYAKLVSSQ